MPTPQQLANEMLRQWQVQRAAGVAAIDRRIPSPTDQAFERDLEVIRQVMERK